MATIEELERRLAAGDDMGLTQRGRDELMERIGRAKHLQAQSDDALRSGLLRSVPTTQDPGTLAPTGTPSGYAVSQECRDAHEALGEHLGNAVGALKRAKRTLHADHPATPIITTAVDELENAKDQHAALGEALEL